MNTPYTSSFSLLGSDPSTASISGRWVSDETSEIYLNGMATGITHSTPYEFANFDSFDISSGFTGGPNTLSFVVYNSSGVGGNPTGLQVQIESATAAVPEPTSLSLLWVLGMAAVIGLKFGRQ